MSETRITPTFSLGACDALKHKNNMHISVWIHCYGPRAITYYSFISTYIILLLLCPFFYHVTTSALEQHLYNSFYIGHSCGDQLGSSRLVAKLKISLVARQIQVPQGQQDCTSRAPV